VPGFLVTKGTVMTCSHLAPVQVATPNTRVLAMGLPVAVATLPSSLVVTGCPFPPSGTPHPCVLVQWGNVAGRVKVMGMPALLQASPAGSGDGVGQAVDQAPQGPAIVSVQQARVAGA
jgi:hypothetical protein